MFTCSRIFLVNCCVWFTLSVSLVSCKNQIHKERKGNWCPYQVSKTVTCKEPNGTETFIGRHFQRCWYWPYPETCGGTYRVLRRTKYITTYKKVNETTWKCCPGYMGSNCDKGCFNCTMLQKIETRLTSLEKKVAKTNRHLPALNPTITYDILPENDNNFESDISNNPSHKPTKTITVPVKTDCSCTPGHPGLPGSTGERGPQGRPGEKGERGLKGDHGPPGPGGPPGERIFPGQYDDDNIHIVPGPPGEPGLPGLEGRKGEPGNDGIPGLRGLPGSSGLQGSKGSKGDRGPTGTSGPPGEPGLVGLPGPQGPAGPPGLPGTIIRSDRWDGTIIPPKAEYGLPEDLPFPVVVLEMMQKLRDELDTLEARVTILEELLPKILELRDRGTIIHDGSVSPLENIPGISIYPGISTENRLPTGVSGSRVPVPGSPEFPHVDTGVEAVSSVISGSNSLHQRGDMPSHTIQSDESKEIIEKKNENKQKEETPSVLPQTKDFDNETEIS